MTAQNKYQRLEEEEAPATEAATDSTAPAAVAGPAEDARSPFERLGEQLALTGLPPGTPPVVLRLDAGDERWVLDLRRGVAPASIATRLAAGAPVPIADLTVTIPSASDVGALMRGDLSPAVALATRRVRLSGDLRQLRALRAVFGGGGDAKPRANVRVEVIGSRVDSGHGAYRLLVTDHFASWGVWRRWRELRALHTELSAAYGPSTPFGQGFNLPSLPRSARASASSAALSARPTQIESYLAALLQGLPCRPRAGVGPPALVSFLGGGAAGSSPPPPGCVTQPNSEPAAMYSPRRFLSLSPQRAPPNTPGGASTPGGDGEDRRLSPRPLSPNPLFPNPLSPQPRSRNLLPPQPLSPGALFPHALFPGPLSPQPSSTSRGNRLSLPAPPPATPWREPPPSGIPATPWGQMPPSGIGSGPPTGIGPATERMALSEGVSLNSKPLRSTPNQTSQDSKATAFAAATAGLPSPNQLSVDSKAKGLAYANPSLPAPNKTSQDTTAKAPTFSIPKLPTPRRAPSSLAKLFVDVRLSQHEQALAKLAAATAHAQTVAALLAILGLSAVLFAISAALTTAPAAAPAASPVASSPPAPTAAATPRSPPHDIPPSTPETGWSSPLFHPSSPLSLTCLAAAALSAALLLLYLAADLSRRLRVWASAHALWWRSFRVGWAFARVYFLIRRRRYAVNSARRRFGHPEDGSEDDNPEIAAIAAKHDTDIGSTLRRHIQPLGGLWVKVGQFLATRADAMPAALVVELRALLDDTESRPLHEVLGTMRDELGEEGIGMVAEMESEPISSASIAQVHKATLIDGRAVAIKVQHAPIRGRMAVDLSYYERLGLLLAWLEPTMPDIKPLLKETLQMHAAEVDFTNEALALSDAAASLSAARATVRLPAPHWRLSTPRVLIMEWMDGLPLSRVTGAELRERGIDPTVLMGRIADAWAIQMFVDGVFNCDPHPGNLLVSYESEIGPVPVLLDWGMTKRLAPAERAAFCLMVHAISEKHADLILAAFDCLGAQINPAATADPLDMIQGLAWSFRDTEGDPAKAKQKKTAEKAWRRAETQGRGEQTQNEQAKAAAGTKKQKPPELLIGPMPACVLFFGRTLVMLQGLATSIGANAAFLPPMAEAARQALLQQSQQRIAEARGAAQLPTPTDQDAEISHAAVNAAVNSDGGSKPGPAPSNFSPAGRAYAPPVPPALPPPRAPPVGSAAHARVARLLADMQELDMILGAQVCVFSKGTVLVDACAGRASPIDASPIRTDSLFQVFEAATPLLATVALQLTTAPGAPLTLSAPLGAAWPAFGNAGAKSDLSLARLLSHTSGLQGALPPAASPEDLGCESAMETHIANTHIAIVTAAAMPPPRQAPANATTTTTSTPAVAAAATSATPAAPTATPALLPAAYEGAPFGWALGGALRAASAGTPLPALLASRLTAPLGIKDEMLLSLPGGQHPRSVCHSAAELPDEADLELLALFSGQDAEEETDTSDGNSQPKQIAQGGQTRQGSADAAGEPHQETAHGGQTARTSGADAGQTAWGSGAGAGGEQQGGTTQAGGARAAGQTVNRGGAAGGARPAVGAGSTDTPPAMGAGEAKGKARSTARLLSPAGLNMRRMRAACVPGASAHASAFALATFYSALAAGRLLPRPVLSRAARRTSTGLLASEEATWGLGFQLGSLQDGEWRHVVLGHAATGGSLAFCVPEIGLAVAITVSRLTADRAATRRILALVLREAVGAGAGACLSGMLGAEDVRS